MLPIIQDTTKNKPTTNVVLDDGIDEILSDLADIIIDDYLAQVTTRCYTEIRPKSKSEDE